jgi:hypothetical protein
MDTRGYPGDPNMVGNQANPLSGQAPPQKPNDPRMQKRADDIRAKFAEQDPSLSRQFTFHEILTFLNFKTQENGQALFDENLLLELFAIIGKSRESIITVEEFVNAYVYAESKIEESIK